MEFIKPTDIPVLNIADFDEHHLLLIDIINRLNDSMHEVDHLKIMFDLLNELLAYGSYHFTAEEQFMRNIGYDGYDEHVAEHRKFAEQIRSYSAAFLSGDVTPTSMLKFLKDWILNHIATQDKKYWEFWQQKKSKNT